MTATTPALGLAAIGQVANKTGDWEPASDLLRIHPKADTLHPAGVIDLILFVTRRRRHRLSFASFLFRLSV